MLQLQAENAALEEAAALKQRHIAVLTVKRARLDRECAFQTAVTSIGAASAPWLICHRQSMISVKDLTHLMALLHAHSSLASSSARGLLHQQDQCQASSSCCAK